MPDLFKIVEIGGVGDNLTAYSHHPDSLYIKIEEPWAGDTENGFGHEGSIRLERVQVRDLINELLKWLETCNAQTS